MLAQLFALAYMLLSCSTVVGQMAQKDLITALVPSELPSDIELRENGWLEEGLSQIEATCV